MIEKTKLSLWDFFVSALSGFGIVLNIVIHCLFLRLTTVDKILQSNPALITVGGLLTIILFGLFFEPLANYVTKLVTTCPLKYPKEFGFKNWDAEIRTLEKKACEYIPEGLEGSTYQYCKNWLLQNAADPSYMPFLAKYGFYRSMSFLLFLNCVSTPFIYQHDLLITVLISSSIFALALVYWRRAGDFYRHMSTTVYLRFIAMAKRD